MSSRPFLGSIGNLFGNDAVLWFIILFLLLFWGCGGYGNDGCDCK